MAIVARKHSVEMLAGVQIGVEFALYDLVSALVSREVACKNTVDE